MKRVIGILLLILLPFALIYAQDETITSFNYQGEDYEIYNVPTEDGVVHQWALVKKGRRSSQFVDPANPDAGLIEWEGSWRALERVVAPSKLEIIPTANASQMVAIDVQGPDRELFDDMQPETVVLSPDGSMVAGIGADGICVYIFVVNLTNCTAFPEAFGSRPRSIYWSPDSKTIAFTEELLLFLEESDIWVFDLATGSYSNLTDDGVTGSLTDELVGSYTLDYIPTWNPSNGDLYFIRSERIGDEGNFSADLYRVSMENKEIHQVTDLSTIASTSFGCSISDSSTFGPALHGAMTISPDGTTMAVLVRELCSGLQATSNTGIWLIDLTEQNPPRMLVNQSQLQTGIPAYRQEIALIPIGIAWAAGGSGLLVSSSNPQYAVILPNNIAHYVDVATGNATPIIDYSMATEEDFDLSRPTLYDVPIGFGVTADGAKLMMISRIPDISILALDLPPGGNMPVRIYTNQDLPPNGINTRFSTAGTDGKMLVQGYLITIHQ